MLNCAGPGVPEISVYSTDNNLIETWENNENVVDILKEKTLPRTIRLNVTVEGGYVAQVSLKLPPNLDESGDVKYPMLVNV